MAHRNVAECAGVPLGRERRLPVDARAASRRWTGV